MHDYSALPDNTPLLVGVGALTQREENPLRAQPALGLMLQALVRAEQDTGVTGLLREADSIQVPRGFWEYGDPGRSIARELGADRARSVLAEIGVLQQTLFSHSCESILAGEEQLILIVGGEARYRERCAQKTDTKIHDPFLNREDTPDQWLHPETALSHIVEEQRGLLFPVVSYAIIESAIRYHRGLSIEAHRREIDQLYAALSRIASTNPDAWRTEQYTAEQIRQSRMLAFPYGTLHSSQWNVDQAAALILCSAGAARHYGIAEDRWIFPLAAAECNAGHFLHAREHLHRNPGAQVAAESVLDLSEISLEKIDFIDLYSCFPSAIQSHALELGLQFSPDQPPSITGGMCFAGGPLNNYMLQAAVKMAGLLRKKSGSVGLLSCVSGILHRHAFSTWASRPPKQRFRSQESGYQEITKYHQNPHSIVNDYQGPAKIAGYTVVYEKSFPTTALAVCTLPGLRYRRMIVQCKAPDIIERMMEQEFCGQIVQANPAGQFTLI